MDVLGFFIMIRDTLGSVPADDNNNWPPSNSQLRRWLENGSVRINGEQVSPTDEIPFPIESIVFFRGRPRQTTTF